MEVDYLNIHRDLVEQCKLGNKNAYKKLYELYSKAMFNVCFRITNDHFEAEDVLQESFVSAFKNIKSFRGESSFGAWLKKIVVNRSINHMNKKKIEMIPLSEQFDETVSDNDYESKDEENMAIEIKLVNQAISCLPDGYRTVLSLYLVEGYDHGEISKIMNITESTSKSQYNRAKKKLKLIIEELWKTS